MSKELIEGIEARRKARGFYMPEDIKDLGDRIEALEAELAALRAQEQACAAQQPAPADEIADAARVLEWMRTPNRKPAQMAFTHGPERQAAYWIEIAQANAETKRGANANEESDWLRNALEHIAGSCDGRAADVAKAALMGPNAQGNRTCAASSASSG